MEVQPGYSFDPRNEVEAQEFDPKRHVIRIWQDKQGNEKKVRILDVSGLRGFFRRVGDFFQHPLQMLSQSERIEEAKTHFFIRRDENRTVAASTLVAKIQQAATKKDRNVQEVVVEVNHWWEGKVRPENHVEFARYGHLALFDHPSALNDHVILQRFLLEYSENQGVNDFVQGINQYLQSRLPYIEDILTTPAEPFPSTLKVDPYQNAKKFLEALKQCAESGALSNLPKEMVDLLKRLK